MINPQCYVPNGTRRWHAYGPNGRLVGQIIELKSNEKVLLIGTKVITASFKDTLKGFIGTLRYIGRR